MTSYRKPEPWLKTHTGTVARSRAAGFTRITVWCVGRKPEGRRCSHNSDVPFDRLPDASWYEIAARMKCTRCASVGYVDMRVDWGEIVDFKRSTLPSFPRG